MTWTNTKPTQEGFYWFQFASRKSPPGIVLVNKTRYDEDFYVDWPGNEEGERLRDMEEGCRWAGPLLQPEGEGVTA